MKALTRRQFELVTLVYRAEVTGKAPPCIRELCAAMGVRSKHAVHDSMRFIRAKGVLDWAPDASGTLHTTAIPVFSGDPATIVDFIPKRPVEPEEPSRPEPFGFAGMGPGAGI